jgi:hypothetical protein
MSRPFPDQIDLLRMADEAEVWIFPQDQTLLREHMRRFLSETSTSNVASVTTGAPQRTDCHPAFGSKSSSSD